MRTAALLAAVVHLIGLQGAAPQDPDAAAHQAAAREALARPVTAGSVPFLIPHARFANVVARMADALRDDRADVRAVAARSIFVLGWKTFAGAVGHALAVERDPTAGAELVRALLAIRGETAEPEAVAAATRLGPAALNAINVTLAHTRPLAVLNWLPELARDESGLADAILRAIAADADAVARVVRSASPDGGIDVIEAAFDRAARQGIVIPAVVVDATLRRGGLLQNAALMYLAGDEAAMRTSLALPEIQSAASGTDEPGWTAAFLELIRRADPAQQRRNLIPIVPTLNRTDAPTGFLFSAAIKRLSPEELKTFRAHLFTASASSMHLTPERATTQWLQRAGVRLAEPVVAGLAAAVAETAGCRPGSEQFGVMDVSYGERGEVRNVRLAADTGSLACREAAAMLAVLEVAPVAALPPAERTDQIVSVFARDALECARRPDRGQRARVADGRDITEPKKLRDAKPSYPPALVAARIDGKVMIEAVIDRGGCISRAEIIARVHPELDIRALVAISQWRFTPTLLNGVPVPVIMTVTVNYLLQ